MRGILDDIIIFDNSAFYEKNRVRIEMKPEKDDLYEINYSSKYIGNIINIYNDWFYIKCGTKLFRIYIKEFANDCIEKEKNQHRCNLEKVKAINKTVVQCNRVLTTEFEAVKTIVKIMEENYENSN